jgi:hypothetical protein
MPTIQFQDSSGNPVERTVSDAEWSQLQQSAGANKFTLVQPTNIDNNQSANISSPSIDQSQSAVNQMLSGLSTPMTLEEIRARESQQKAEIQNIANLTFDPLVRDARATGEKQLGSSQAQLGVSRGLGFSSAETSFLNSVQGEIDTKIRDIENQKAQFIATQNFEAANRAEQMLMQMQEMQNNIILTKGTMALQMFGMEQSAYQFEKTFAQSLDSDMFNRKIQMANLTGLFEGAETMAAKQARIQNELAEASITGTFRGDPTLAKQQFLEDIKNQSFTNQIALFSMLSSIPQGQSVTITMPDGTTKTFKGLQRPIGTGTKADDKKDVFQLAAENIYAAEIGGYSTDDNWAAEVNLIVSARQELGAPISYQDASKILMQRVKALKKEPLDLMQEIENISSELNVPHSPRSMMEINQMVGTSKINLFNWPQAAGEGLADFAGWLYGWK